MSYKSNIAIICFDYPLSQRTAKHLAMQSDMTYACSSGLMDYICGHRSPKEIATLTSVEFLRSKSEDTAYTLADSTGTVIALNPLLLTSKTLAEIAKSSYIVLNDTNLINLKAKIATDEFCKYAQIDYSEIKQIWLQLRCLCDLKVKDLKRYDSLCLSIRHWIEEKFK